MKHSWLLIVILLAVSVSGCANRDKYYNAVKEQNTTVQLNNAEAARQADLRQEKKEASRQEHRERMAALMAAMIRGVTLTPGKTDDIMAPLLFLMMEDKWALAELVDTGNDQPVAAQPVQKIEPPADGVDYMKAGLPWAGTLLAGVLGWQSLETTGDMAANAGARYYMNGDNNRLNKDSYNTGSYNHSGGDQTITATSNGSGSESEETVVCESADDMTSLAGCSCGSCWEGKCGDASICPKN